MDSFFRLGELFSPLFFKKLARLQVPFKKRAPYLQVGCRYTYRELTDLPSNSESQQGSLQQSTPIDKSRPALNNSLIPRDISSIRSSLQFPWSEASGRTKRYGYINPRTYIQTHTPTVVQGEVGWLEPPSVFVTLRYFEKFLQFVPLTDSLLFRLQDDVNIIGYRCR